MINTLTAAAKAIRIKAYGATGDFITGKSLRKIDIDRRLPEDDEVIIEVIYCGVCYPNIYQLAINGNNALYPSTQGQQIIGRIVGKGSAVNNFSENEIVGVELILNSARQCNSFSNGEEQYGAGLVAMNMACDDYFRPGRSVVNTFRGSPTHIVANKKFVLRIPEVMDISSAVCILRAGVPTYAPFRKWAITKGDKVGIIGIGGLGHMAVMIAKALGARVTAITFREENKKTALKLGADEVLVAEDDLEMLRQEISFDFLLCTIPVSFDLNPYVKLLNPHGTLVTVGQLAPCIEPTSNLELEKYNRSINNLLFGSIEEAQELLDFCAAHHISPPVKMIQMEEIKDAFRIKTDDEVRLGSVVDMV